MQVQWLTRSGTAAEVIVVFGGWAVGAEAFAHLAGPEDVLFAHDYRTLDEALPDLSGYPSRRLLAWSFGVAAYAHWQAGRPDPFTRKTAIAGTLSPVDRALGIPPRSFAVTRDSLSSDSFAAFLRRCYGEARPVPDLDVSARRAELDAVAAHGAAPDPVFDRIVIPAHDRIFPPANMARAWAAQQGRVVPMDGPHAPFALWQRWEQVP